MSKIPAKRLAVAISICAALSMAAARADDTNTKPKKKSVQRPVVTRSYQPTNAQYNQCVHDQFRYPELDIRC